jgi:chemotaxis protein CheD
MVKQRVIVQVSDAKASADVEDLLITYSLGSCIGVALYDPAVRVGGMLHYQLPESSLDRDKAQQQPFMFADTGMRLLLDALCSRGVDPKRLQIKIAGGAGMANGPQGFDIGKRNHTAIRKIAWQQRLFIQAEDVGGSTPRNLYLDMADGSVTVKAGGVERPL